MTELLIILVKLILSSALLYAFYWFVLRNKASYTMARLYLLLLPFVSIAMSGLTFKVIQPQPVVVEVSSTSTSTPSTSEEGSDALPVFYSGSTATASSNAESTAPSLFTRFCEAFSSDWLLYAWAVIAVVLIVIALYHMIGLYVMSRRMKSQTTPEGFKLIRSPEVPAPCSFAKTVFMPTTLTSNNEDLILRHEKAHIRHAHFVDVWVMELMTRHEKVLQDPAPDPAAAAYGTEGGAGRNTTVVYTTLKYQLIIVCYGPACEEYALRIRSVLYLDGSGFPRRILRSAGIFPVPDPPQPSVLYEEEGSLWRKRADLTVSLRVLEERRGLAGGSIKTAPAVIFH